MSLLTAPRLTQMIERFTAKRIAVVGDFFLDKYLEVDPKLAEPSVETGKIAHQVAQVRHSPGAAGTVVSNLAALGTGKLYAVGFTGDDGEGFDLRKGLAAIGCDTTHLHRDVNRYTPQYLKPRDLGVRGLEGEHNRYDTKNRTPTPRDLERRVLASVETLLKQIDALVIMDQVEQEECGVLTTNVRQAICDLAPKHRNVIFFADSRRRIGLYRNVIIKPNEFEAMGAQTWAPGQDVPMEQLHQAVAGLRQRNNAPVFCTRGADGIAVSDPWTVVPAVKLTGELDPTGAGDSVSAGTVLALAAGATAPQAALVGNLVASITIQQLGTTGTAKPMQLPERLTLWQSQQK